MTTTTEPVIATARVGQRGRLVLPTQIQRAAHITEGALVALRTASDGTVTIEPLWAVRDRLRESFAPLLAGYLPTDPAQMLVGGHPLPENDASGPLPTALLPLSDGIRISPASDQRVVFTAGAILAWIGGGPGSRANTWLYQAVLPEPAVTELVTVLARAGAHEQADTLLAELAVVGVRQPGPAKHRATLAADTALALELTAQAADGGVDLTMPDALCTAAARRLGIPLLAAGLLPAGGGVTVTEPEDQDGREPEPPTEQP
ncbi:AbrB/MazE/SpoVT family DNA-binding domain-containing protein [Kitasatospora sp. NPDC059146]|uniref:AbrB/MazE/SpoVT family DNA-binding domain-containing protein n=1 Tax=Kitasatospora sp. NPDC059146 TaxID=3346741 RepID=UPI0036AA4E8E